MPLSSGRADKPPALQLTGSFRQGHVCPVLPRASNPQSSRVCVCLSPQRLQDPFITQDLLCFQNHACLSERLSWEPESVSKAP